MNQCSLSRLPAHPWGWPALRTTGIAEMARSLVPIGLVLGLWSIFPIAAFPQVSASVAEGQNSAQSEVIDYLADVAPIFHRHCVSCHGPLEQRAGLRLDAGRLALEGAETGAVIEPGDPGASFLIEAVTGDPSDWRMPPEGPGLSAEEVATLTRWIALGAEVPDDETVLDDPDNHWFFRAPDPVIPPTPTDPRFVGNPIDRFLASRWAESGVTPNPEADKATLLRRVTIDLTGLPPTRDQLQAFLADGRPDAYERRVDALLDSTAFGERWGRHWLDVWRYSDEVSFADEGLSLGVHHLWRWRDWAVMSLNADKGYDRLIAEMLAGDELAPERPEIIAATGFLARSRDHNGSRDTWMQAAVEHTAQAFLGLTLRCARCHDHKYDPLPQEDYYRFRAFFEPMRTRLDRLPGGASAEQVGLGRVYDGDLKPRTYFYKSGDARSRDDRSDLEPGFPSPLGGGIAQVEPVPMPVATFYPGIQAFIRDQELAEAESELDEAVDALRAADAAPRDVGDPTDPDLELLTRRVKVARIALEATRAVLAADAAAFREPAPDPEASPRLARDAVIAQRREALARAELIRFEANVELEQLEVSPDPDPSEIEAMRSRLRDAQRAVEEAREQLGHPGDDYQRLTDRYLWISTGRRSALARWITDPNNPATARVAVNHVWLRHFGRPLVESVFDFGLNGRAPTHPHLLDWLAAEFVGSGWSLKALHRRIVTSAAYKLSSMRRPDTSAAQIDPDNRLLWRAEPRRLEAEVVRDGLLHLAGRLDRAVGGPPLDPRRADKVPRRSLYFRHNYEVGVELVAIFDGPNPDECYRREVSIVPQQALALSNSRFSFDRAAEIAGRLVAEMADPSDDRAFVEAAFEQILTRGADGVERDACLRFLGQQRGTLDGHDEPGPRARASLVHVLINHNDFLTVR